MPVLPDVIRSGLKAVFCGLAVGNRSAHVQAYYAGRGNQEDGKGFRALPV